MASMPPGTEVIRENLRQKEGTVKVILLGTGHPAPSLKRASASYLIRVGGDVILFDHGPGAYWRLMQAGVKATDVTHVFLSHLHYDHCLDLTRLFLSRWDMGAGRVPPLKMHGPPGFQRFIDGLFGPEGAFKPDLTARTHHPASLELYRERGGTGTRAWPDTRVTELAEGDVVEGRGWRLRLASVPHHQPHLVCYGFRLEADDGVVAYTGDIGHPFTLGGDGTPIYKQWDEPGVRGHYKPIDGLIQDADLAIQYLHLPNADQLLGGKGAFPRRRPGNVADRMHRLLAEIARDAGVKRLVVSHLNPALDHDGVRERVMDEIKEIFKGELIWGEDLTEIEVGKNEARAAERRT